MMSVNAEDVTEESRWLFDVYDRRINLLVKAGVRVRVDLLEKLNKKGLYITDADWQKLRRRRIGELYQLLRQTNTKISDLSRVVI
jgi:hypothetical protein